MSRGDEDGDDPEAVKQHLLPEELLRRLQQARGEAAAATAEQPADPAPQTPSAAAVRGWHVWGGGRRAWGWGWGSRAAATPPGSAPLAKLGSCLCCVVTCLHASLLACSSRQGRFRWMERVSRLSQGLTSLAPNRRGTPGLVSCGVLTRHPPPLRPAAAGCTAETRPLAPPAICSCVLLFPGLQANGGDIESAMSGDQGNAPPR